MHRNLKRRIEAAGSGYELATGAVPYSADWERVRDLPRVPWAETENLAADIVRTWGPAPDHQCDDRCEAVPLVPWHHQAKALEYLAEHRGLFAPIGVGLGKTWITYMIPHVFPEAARYLLLVPNSLKDDTWRKFDKLRLHWDWPDHCEVRVEAYETLSRIKSDGWLERYNPDIIAGDEIHKIRRFGAAVTKKVVRHIRERYLAGDPPIFAALSGTMIGKSYMDIHHLLAFALGEGSPLPLDRGQAKKWAAAVDQDPPTRKGPGVLTRLLPSDEPPTLANVREAVDQRLAQAPGVLRVSAGGEDLRAGLEITTMEPELPVEIQASLRRLWKERTSPGPEQVECTPTDLYRHTGTLVWGFYYTWDPWPPDEWLRIRGAWAKWLRSVEDEPGLESELRIVRACEAGRLDSHGLCEAWQQVRSTFNEQRARKPVWLCDDVVDQLADTSGILWVRYRALGERLQARLGVPFFREKGLDPSGMYVEDCKRPLICCSIKANATGRNLQHRWSHNEILNGPANATAYEQLLGRTHREGQRADKVTARVWLGHPAMERQWHNALENAEFLQSRDCPQKLLYGLALKS